MVLVTSNKLRRLICVQYVQKVSPDELRNAQEDLKALLPDLPSNCRFLADLSQLEFMDVDCLTEIGRTMDLINQHGVEMIVRVIPDPSKDIGLNILAIFHYPNQPRMVTCQDLADALRKLDVY